ncbi:hypothetical protein DCAR_0728266 [Daucus carota subsp. sativus]|uniref:Uncharacterized protein n=1 Tax=Daucus carota subsp. sativus TaxID=79200 RepID=A0A164T923_DAUCS|nr:hypothetical protein DCAR_0728266 [Daucus carota subsp. sativus]
MAFTTSTPVNKLDPSKIKWEIKVRAQAVWKGITRDTKEFRGLNILFIDDSNSRIHAFIGARISSIFEPSLEEGQMYHICSFSVHRYTGYESHRCVRTDLHIYFSDYTSMQKITVSVPRIPNYNFDFYDLSSLGSTNDEKRFLFDVIGVLGDREPLLKYMSESKEEKMQLKCSITDGRITFFDEFALKFDKALEKQADEITIVIIGCGKIGHYLGELNISNYPATRFFINVDHHSVRMMKLWSLKPTFRQKVVVKKDEPRDVLLSVACIKDLKEEFNERRVCCSVKVEKVEEVQWFYHVCPKCSEELVAIDGRFKCTKYKRYIPYPERRFRISVICSDESGVIFIALGDSEVRKLIKKNVFEVDLDHAKESKDSDFPAVFKQFAGKVHSITLKINLKNVIKKSEVYESVDIAELSGISSATISNIEPSGETDDNRGDTVTEMEEGNEEESPVKSLESVSKDKIRKNVKVNTSTVTDGDDDFVLIELISEGKSKKCKK